MAAGSASGKMIDQYAEMLVDIAETRHGRGMAAVEQIITGPTRRPDTSWLVVLYRSSAVVDKRQLIGYAMYIAEAAYAQLLPDELEFVVNNIYTGAIDEPPGSDLPGTQLNPGAIAWWQRADGWSAQSGPPDDGLPATRVHHVTPRPRPPIVRDAAWLAADEVIERMVRSYKPAQALPELRALGMTASPGRVQVRLVYDPMAAEGETTSVCAGIEAALNADLPNTTKCTCIVDELPAAVRLTSRDGESWFYRRRGRPPSK